VKLSDLTDPAAVEKALHEFDTLGREVFLAQYGFGPARTYFVERDGKRYDSKAIAGAAIAHQYPEQGALSNKHFSGGEHTVAKQLGLLGFTVIRTRGSRWTGRVPTDLARGDELSNEDLGLVFQCGNNGGMRRSHATNTLIIVSDPTKGRYIDEWRDGVLHYCGMGLEGPQSLAFAQNKTLAESGSNGVAVHLFEVHRAGVYEYVGKVELASGPYESQQSDANGMLRRVWIFPVRPLDGMGAPSIPQDTFWEVFARQRREAKRLSDEEIHRRAQALQGSSSSRVTTSTTHVRNEYVAEYARRRAGGKCELCGKPAPFQNRSGEPYLESHHIKWLARGGGDTIDNTVALCPNCHREMHILDSKESRKLLLKKVQVVPSHFEPKSVVPGGGGALLL
jgi:5-methylcytosine-specific restriction protein A